MRMRTLKRPKRAHKAQVTTLIQTKQRSENSEAHRAYAASHQIQAIRRGQQQALANTRRVLGFNHSH